MAANTPAESRRLNVAFSPSAYEALETLAARKGTSLADVLRDAITLEKWISDAIQDGSKILIEKDGVARELVIR